MRGIPVAVCVLFTTSALAAPLPQNGRLSGSVKDTEGAAIAGARVLIHWDPSGSQVGLKTNVGIKQDIELISREDGSFEVELPPGFYDVFVSAMVFTPECRKVRVREGESAVFKAKLRVSAIVSRELP